MPVTHYSVYSRRRRRVKPWLWAFVFLVLSAAGISAWIFRPALPTGEGGSRLSFPEESAVLISPISSEPEKASSEQKEDAVSSEESWENAGSESSEELSGPVDTDYDFTQPVPEAEPVDDSYFSDAVFIGDSRTQGFILYSGLSGTTSYAGRGLSVDKVMTDEIISTGEKKVTVIDALQSRLGEFSKVYLMFGVNELGWNYPNVFRDKYREVVRKIKELEPEALIYIQSILPVSREKSESSDFYTIDRIAAFNQLLKDMAAEEQVYYVDVAEGIQDDSGFLPDEASTDGVHLNKPYCRKWLEYLKNHTVPQPEGQAWAEEQGKDETE